MKGGIWMRFAASRLLLGTIMFLAGMAVGCSQQQEGAEGDGEQELNSIVVGSLAFPSLTNPIPTIIQEQGFDEQNGLDLQAKPTGDVAAYYSGLATGQTDTLAGGPIALQNLRLDDAPVQIVATLAELSAFVIVSDNPEIENVEDLRGLKLAADMSAADFQILSVYADSLDLNLEEDVTVVQAAPPEALSQLNAGRVDAAMLFEPTATAALQGNPDRRVIFNGADAWQEVTGQKGWYLVVAMRQDAIEGNPEIVDQWISTLQDFQRYVEENPGEADALVSESVDLPEGVFQEAIESGRADYEVRPVWEGDVEQSIFEMFQAAVDTGFLPQLPEREIIYKPDN